jgi:hypothetical protein
MKYVGTVLGQAVRDISNPRVKVTIDDVEFVVIWRPMPDREGFEELIRDMKAPKNRDGSFRYHHRLGRHEGWVKIALELYDRGLIKELPYARRMKTGRNPYRKDPVQLGRVPGDVWMTLDQYVRWELEQRGGA